MILCCRNVFTAPLTCCGVLLLVLGELSALGQGTVIFHNTGGGQSLVSEVRSLSIDPSLQQPSLVFNFGFATDEIPSPGTFLDSFTVTLEDVAQRISVVYLTADATGIAWAPPTPGAWSMDPASITHSLISYPSLQPVLTNRIAFQVTAPIPAQFTGSVNVYFDLFDNLDNQNSQAWFSGLSLVGVPEPSVWALSLLMAGLLCGSSRRDRK
jgi:hypothetical protein